MARDDDREVTFEIVEELGVISTQNTGWKKELNLVRWNSGPEKYDIREWDPHHERMSRGITLKEDEMRRVLDIMKKRRKNSFYDSDKHVAEAAEIAKVSEEISANA